MPVYDEKTGHVYSPDETAKLADDIIKDQLTKQAKNRPNSNSPADKADIALFQAKVSTIQRY